MAYFRRTFAVLLVVWLVLPLIPLFIWSIARRWAFPEFLPKETSLKAWSYAFSDQSGVLASFGVTTLIALLATLLAILLGVPAGRALGLYQFHGKAVVELVMLTPILVPGISVTMGLQSVLIGFHLTNTVAGVVIAHVIPTLPYMVFVMAGVFAAYDPEAEEQARSLGASKFQVFRHVTLPAIMPGIIVGACFTFLVSWSQYILTLTIGGGRILTLPLLLFQFATAGRNDITGAISMLYILPGILILIVTARNLTGHSAAFVRIGK